MRFRFLFALAAATFVAACGSNPIYGNATFKTGLDTLAVFALNGTPIGSYSAITVASLSLSRAEALADGSIDFDLALDIDAR